MKENDRGIQKKTFGLTGGIATGKSTAMKWIRALSPSVTLFDSDASVRRLLETEEVVGQVVGLLGRDVLRDGGNLDRALIRSLVFENSEKRRGLEGILHPKVRKECLVNREEWLKEGASTLFVAEVPLLFEGEFDFDQDLNLVVATSEETQRSRLKGRDQFSEEMISAILSAQLPIKDKVIRGDVVFWNEGPEMVLKNQISQLFKFFNL